MIKYVFLQEYAKKFAKNKVEAWFCHILLGVKSVLRNKAVSNFFAEISAEIKL